jgi:pyrroline-5-carboxylate reductase
MGIGKYERIGLIGGGNMAQAIVAGILKAKLFEPACIYISHPSSSLANNVDLNKGINLTDSNLDVVDKCNLLVLCVKPQVLDYVSKELRPFIDPGRHLLVSICAGISLQRLQTLFDKSDTTADGLLRIIRCTLNTASIVGESCSVFSGTNNLDKSDLDLISNLLSSVGMCLGFIKESNIDAAMSISASGIAYMYLMCDAMADGGVKMGLSKALSLKMAIQTMTGAAKLLYAYPDKHPQQLKDEVCSPGGMTICGVHELEKHGFKHALMSAIEVATKRAKELNA